MPENHEQNELRRVLILDFDGVVVDTEWLHFESWQKALDEILGAQLLGGHEQIVGRTLDELYEDWTTSGLVSAGTLSPEVKQRLLARKTDLFFEIGAKRLCPIPGVADLVRRAQTTGWYAAIASRGRRIRLLKTLELARVPAVFELVLSSSDIVDPASDRKIHARAAHMLCSDPAHCVVVEDSTAGIADALASGIGFVVGFTSSASREELYAAGAHHVVDSLDDVPLPSPFPS